MFRSLFYRGEWLSMDRCGMLSRHDPVVPIARAGVWLARVQPWLLLCVLVSLHLVLLTGDDAEALTRAAKREQAIATFKEVWWLVPIGIGVLWWMF